MHLLQIIKTLCLRESYQKDVRKNSEFSLLHKAAHAVATTLEEAVKAAAKRRSLLGAFRKLRKATMNFVLPVHPSVRLSVSPYRTTLLALEGFS
jgi:hypothetical protein